MKTHWVYIDIYGHKMKIKTNAGSKDYAEVQARNKIMNNIKIDKIQVEEKKHLSADQKAFESLKNLFGGFGK